MGIGGAWDGESHFAKFIRGEFAPEEDVGEKRSHKKTMSNNQNIPLGSFLEKRKRTTRALSDSAEFGSIRPVGFL